MNLPLPGAPSGASVSRRRVLIGAAWATPAILVATGSPPAAASTRTAPSSELAIGGSSAHVTYTANRNRWVTGVGSLAFVDQVSVYLQARPLVAGNAAMPRVTYLSVTVTVEGAKAPVRWGMGNDAGVASPWTVAAGPSLSPSGAFSVTLELPGVSWGPYDGVNLDRLWVETTDAVRSGGSIVVLAGDAAGATMTSSLPLPVG